RPRGPRPRPQRLGQRGVRGGASPWSDPGVNTRPGPRSQSRPRSRGPMRRPLQAQCKEPLRAMRRTLPPQRSSCPDLLKPISRFAGMLLDQVGVDFIALENRVAELERQMRMDYEVLPPVVQDLKQEVTRFRAKLEKSEHLGWMGPPLRYGQLRAPFGVCRSAPPNCAPLQVMSR
ncbi:hypothetical protein FOCC_FOCC007516, partial [Frankliniella occidentalis]